MVGDELVRFDSTYEGLKLTTPPSCPGRTRGFDSTYEGLKLAGARSVLCEREGFRQYL